MRAVSSYFTALSCTGVHTERRFGSPAVSWFYQRNPIIEDEGQVRQESMLKAEDEVIVMAVRLQPYGMFHSEDSPVFSSLFFSPETTT